MDACRRLFFFSLSLSQFYRIRARSRRESSPGDVEQRGSRFCCCATVYNIRNCVPGCWPIRRRVSVESGGGGSEKSPRGSAFFAPVECCCCCLLVDTLPKHCDNKQTRPRRQAPLFQFVVSFRADAAGWWPRRIFRQFGDLCARVQPPERCANNPSAFCYLMLFQISIIGRPAITRRRPAARRTVWSGGGCGQSAMGPCCHRPSTTSDRYTTSAALFPAAGGIYTTPFRISGPNTQQQQQL